MCGNLFVFGGPHLGGVASKGFILDAPSISNASPAYLNDFEAGLRSILRWLDPGSRLQFSWSTDSDFLAPLLGFHERTESLACSTWSRRMRNERFVRYHERAASGMMRRDRLRVYITRAWTGTPQANEAVGGCYCERLSLNRTPPDLSPCGRGRAALRGPGRGEADDRLRAQSVRSGLPLTRSLRLRPLPQGER